MHPSTQDFFKLFEGNLSSYGTYTLTDEKKPNGKRLGTAASIAKPVTVELYAEHLAGQVGLGITPINKDSNVVFGAIDIDEYPLDLVALNKRVQEMKLPVVVCRTKSGGAHLYMFMKRWAPAGYVQKKLREISAALGYGTSEIYPRQSQLLSERGDVGNWINLPYFKASKTMRYALGREGKALTLEDFIKWAYVKMVDLEDLDNMRLTAEETLPGGPPCLQQLVKQGFPEGTRNNGLMALGVYAIKAYGDGWQKHLEDYNNKYMQPPLASEEVMQVMKSLKKKEYSYACKSQPIQAFCNAAVCRTCKFGVGGADLGMPKMGTLTKLTTNPPLWFIDVETGEDIKRMELSTDELQQPALFQKRCMEALNIMPIVMKREGWMSIIQKLLSEVTVVEIPQEATPQGQLMGLIEQFCMSRVRAKVKDELLMGKPWIDEGPQEVHFRFADLIQFLTVKKFNLLPLNKIGSTIKHVPGCHKDFHCIKGMGINVWVIPIKYFNKQQESFDAPPQPKEVI